MGLRSVITASGVACLLAVTTMPASAQVADFFCSTFSLGCEPPPPPPPPAPPPPAPEPVEPVHHGHRMHHKVKKVKHTAEPKADAAPAAAQ